MTHQPPPHVHIDETEFIKITAVSEITPINDNSLRIISILQSYLKAKGFYEAMSALLLESNVSLFSDNSPELLFLQRIVLQGRYELIRFPNFSLFFSSYYHHRWDDVMHFFHCVKESFPEYQPQVSFQKDFPDSLLIISCGLD